MADPFDGDVVAAVVSWPENHAYAAAFLVTSLDAPGLAPDERAALYGALWQSVSVHGERDDVVERLCAHGNRSRFRQALAEPDSPDGQRLYTMLRDIAAGDEAIQTLLAEIG